LRRSAGAPVLGPAGALALQGRGSIPHVAASLPAAPRTVLRTGAGAFQPPHVSRRRGQCVQCAALTALTGGAPRRVAPVIG
jgi:hypothetical protein